MTHLRELLGKGYPKSFDEARELYDTLPALLVALESIAKNTCCGSCQEAALVAQKALATIEKVTK